jgi:hypothetical protein
MPFDNASAFSFQHLGYRFSLMADRFNPQQAHLFGLSFSKVWML